MDESDEARLEALAKYLAVNAWQIEATRAAIAALDRGDEVAHEAVRDWVELWGADNEGRPPSVE